MAKTATLTFHFLDGSSLSATFPRQPDNDPLTVVSNVKKAIDQDKILVEVDRKLLIIPMNGVKYIKVDPMPAQVPASVIRGGKNIKVT